LTRWEIAFLTVVFVAGLALRLRLALTTYLNPDEALQALLSFAGWPQVWRNSLTVTHPPLLILITHLVSMVSRTGIAVRMVPILAGSLFPVVLFVWLRRVAGIGAGMTAMFLLTLAPHLVTVSAQLRSYTLALLLLSASLLALDHAIDTGRWQTMWVFNVLLWACIFSDYSMAWFAGAAGVYALLRLRGSSAAIKLSWAAGQAVALALFGTLYVLQVRHFRDSSASMEALTEWLQGAFPEPRTLLIFPFSNTLKQFAYLADSVPLGLAALLMFATAVILLWTGRTTIGREKSRALALLLAVPFLLGIAGAYARAFPYGRTRHTLVLGLFAAAGIGIFMEQCRPRIAAAILWAALLLTPLWHHYGPEDPQDISTDRFRKQWMIDFREYMHAHIPPDALIFTEGETLLMLAYYEGGVPLVSSRGFTEVRLGGRWRAVMRDYKYNTPQEYTAAMRAFRAQYWIPEPAPVWVIDGGWDVVSGPPDPALPFTKAIRIFQSESP
jgi:Dolichyl-phosphate-mannose-protein mannosyltransferase